MGAQFEAALESNGSLHQDDRERALVDGSGSGPSQQAARILHIRSIGDDGFEALAGDATNRLVHGGAVFDVNFQVAEDPAQDAHRFFVGTQ